MTTTRLWLATILVVLITPAFVAADDPKDAPKEQPKDAPKDPPKDKKDDAKDAILAAYDVWVSFYKGIDAEVKDVTFEQEDVKSFVDNHEAYNDLCMSDGQYIANTASLKARFDYMIKNEAYLKWAKDKKLDADKWLRKYFRLSCTGSRVKKFEEEKATEEKAKKDLVAQEKNASGDMLKMLKDSEEYIDAWVKALDKVIAVIVAPTDAERKVIDSTDEAFVDALDSITNG